MSSPIVRTPSVSPLLSSGWTRQRPARAACVRRVSEHHANSEGHHKARKRLRLAEAAAAEPRHKPSDYEKSIEPMRRQAPQQAGRAGGITLAHSRCGARKRAVFPFPDGALINRDRTRWARLGEGDKRCFEKHLIQLVLEQVSPGARFLVRFPRIPCDPQLSRLCRSFPASAGPSG